jgi:hypothetical protein
MTRRRTELYVAIGLLLIGCFCVRGADSVRERNWTMRTPWGPVGICELSYSQPTYSGGSVSADRFGHIDFCFGPLGRFSRKWETPRMDADWAALPFAVGMVAFVTWTHRRGFKNRNA